MTPAIYEAITTVLKREPLPLDKVYTLAKDGGSNWHQAQIHLFLACMDGVEVEATPEKTPLVRLGDNGQKKKNW
ncbi:hypothetical protein [Nostoc sp. DSM 114160]|jgi:hypothetical protein